MSWTILPHWPINTSMYAKAISSKFVVAINMPYLIWPLQGTNYCHSQVKYIIRKPHWSPVEQQFVHCTGIYLATIYTSLKSSTPTLSCSNKIKLGYQIHHSVPTFWHFFLQCVCTIISKTPTCARKVHNPFAECPKQLGSLTIHGIF